LIEANQFAVAAAARGYDFYSGVPCSFLAPLINRVAGGGVGTYMGAASEGEAVAIAAGAWLGGRQTVVMCQNSGLGNAVNPLTSLNAPFRIPTLLIVTWRGEPGLQDEPQHELMGRITHDLLAAMEIGHGTFPVEAARIGTGLDQASAAAERGRSYALVMRRDSLRDDKLEPTPLPAPKAGRCIDLTMRGTLPSRVRLLERLLAVIPTDAAIVATTGKCGRELFTLGDREQHLYQVGSMGCASGMGLGIAMTTSAPVIVLDGDGAALMKLGTLATIGAYRPKHLLHIIMDNGSYDSTGGQPTTSRWVDFAAVGLSCGYPRCFQTDSADGFEQAVIAALAGDETALVHARLRPGSLEKLGRPTIPPP
jgi:phosphonopyruvate decarboxylase